MITVPFYNLILLPGVTYHFQQDYAKELLGRIPENQEEILFTMMKTEKRPSDLKAEDLYPIGLRGIFLGKGKEGNVGIKAIERVAFSDIEVENGQIRLMASPIPPIEDETEAVSQERFKNMRDELLQFTSGFQWGLMARGFIMSWDNLEEMAAYLSVYLSIDSQQRYRILASDSLKIRHDLIIQAVEEMMTVTQISQEASQKQTKQHEERYREEAIKKQIQILQKELDEMHPETINDARRFEKAIEEAGMNETAKAEAVKVLRRLKQEGETGHEYGMLYDYLDFVTSLSWKKQVFEEIDLKRAEEILEEDHYGIRKVKERVLEQLAVMALTKKQAGSILLFVGPPGTGKTSVGRSIARALNRAYVRISLGGIRDESEIRGHRRTYVGAMPGRIMEGIKRSGVSNPVVVLDEVDKLVASVQGDPAGALLEVLDPEQNSTFTDHYMNVPYDLSDVLFICTANQLDSIPAPLLNRMEMIRFSSYTESEKIEIARRYLLPKAMETTGLAKEQLRMTDKALTAYIREYTRESGVRSLDRLMKEICRHAAVMIVRGETEAVTVRMGSRRDFVSGAPMEAERVPKETRPGIVTGLAWTSAGGDILYMETLLNKGRGELRITGQLGDVMKESAMLAVSLVKSMIPQAAEILRKNDLHIHVPAGATPKDGPSAGVTLTTAIASLTLGKAVDPALAMTGEISLTGKVMPIGGLMEKLSAAGAAGVKKVLIPQANEKDLKEIPKEILNKLEIVPVSHIREVLEHAGLL